jgi:hypothetical protein
MSILVNDEKASCLVPFRQQTPAYSLTVTTDNRLLLDIVLVQSGFRLALQYHSCPGIRSRPYQRFAPPHTSFSTQSHQLCKIEQDSSCPDVCVLLPWSGEHVFVSSVSLLTLSKQGPERDSGRPMVCAKCSTPQGIKCSNSARRNSKM